MKKSTLILCSLIIANISIGKPGPEIPAPSPSLEQAVINAQNFYKQVYTAKFDDKTWHEKVCIVEVIYTPADNGEWNWLITFRHLKQTDSSVTFKVNRDGSIQSNPVRLTK